MAIGFYLKYLCATCTVKHSNLYPIKGGYNTVETVFFYIYNQNDRQNLATDRFMTASSNYYNMFFRFFESFSKSGIEGIAPDDTFMLELDRLMEVNKQLFYISDVILMDIFFVSNSVKTMFGIEPEKVSQGYFLTTTHPEDYKKHSLARSRLMEIAQDLYNQKKGFKIISVNVRARKPEGTYFNVLYQAYVFYSKVPYESVFLILVLTDISEFKKFHKGSHFYNGEDLRFFRYPDDELLMTGSIYSPTEMKIIEIIDNGFSSKEIADQLFRSIHTINTHRNNIRDKSGKSSVNDVIHELKEKGLL